MDDSDFDEVVLPQGTQPARLAAYGPVVGEHHNAAMFGPNGNPLRPGDVAASPDYGFDHGDVVDVGDGTLRTVADLSYYQPGMPTSRTIELRNKADQGHGYVQKVNFDEVVLPDGTKQSAPASGGFDEVRLPEGPNATPPTDVPPGGGLSDAELAKLQAAPPSNLPPEEQNLADILRRHREEAASKGLYPEKLPTTAEDRWAAMKKAEPPPPVSFQEKVLGVLQGQRSPGDLVDPAMVGIRRALNLPTTGPISEQDIQDTLGGQGEVPLTNIRIPKEERPAQDLGQFTVKTAWNTLSGLVDFANSPTGAATIVATGGLSTAAQRLAALGFSAQAVKGAIDSVMQGDLQGAAEHLGIAFLAGHGARESAKAEFAVERPQPSRVPGAPDPPPTVSTGQTTIAQDVSRALERRFTTSQPTGAWEIGPDGRPTPVVPRTFEAPSPLEPAPTLEDILIKTTPSPLRMGPPQVFDVSPDITQALARRIQAQQTLTPDVLRILAERAQTTPIETEVPRAPVGPISETTAEKAMRITSPPLQTAGEIAAGEPPSVVLPDIPGVTESPAARPEQPQAPSPQRTLPSETARIAELKAEKAAILGRNHPSIAIGQRLHPTTEARLAEIDQELNPTPVLPTEEAPQAPGTVRLYHGSSTAAPQAGRDFTTHRQYAADYAAKSERTGEGTVWYVDVPEGSLKTHDEYGQPMTRVVVPPEVAAQAKPIGAPEAAPAIPPEPYTPEAAAARAAQPAPTPLVADLGPTSTKNAVVGSERAARNLEPVVKAASQDFGTVWDESGRQLAQDPEIGRRLVDQFKAKPGAADDVTNAHLLRETIRRQGEYDAAVKAVNKSAPGSPENALAQERLAHASQDYYDVHQADRNAGTGTGRGLNARKMLALDQYNLARMEARRRAANGGRPLNRKQYAETTKAAAKLDDLRQKGEAATAAAQKAALDAEMKRVRTDIDNQVRASSAKGTNFWDDLEAKAKARIRERAGRLSAGVDPTVLVDVAQIGAAKLARGIKSFDAWSSQMLTEVGDWIKPHLDDLYKRAKELVNRYQPAEKRSFKPTGSTAEAIKEFKKQDIYKVRTLKATDILKEKITRQDYTKAVRSKLQLDRHAERMRAEYQRVKNDFDRAVRKDELLNRPLWQRTLDTIAKGERAMKFAGLTIYPKLAAAAATRIGTRPLEQLVKSVIGQVPGLRRVHQAAPLSGFSPRAEVAALAGIIKGAREAPGRIIGRHAPESELYGKPELDPKSWLDIPAQTHGAVKAPVEEAERARATTMLEAHARKQGLDLSDPRVRQDIGQTAEQEAKRSIFMQDNIVSTGWKGLIRYLETQKVAPISGKVAAFFGKVLLPIVRVPTNIALEAGMHTPVIGQIAPTVKLLQVMRRGMETIRPEEANMIMSHYSKGAIGAGLFFTGYFMAANGQIGGFYQPGKRKPGSVSPMAVKIGGVEIPGLLMHAPAFLVMQAGATFYNASHHTDKHGQPDQSAVLRTAKGLADEIPFVKEMGVIDGALADEYAGRKARGQFVSGNIVPQFVRNIAAFTDPLKEPQYRSPKTALDYVRRDIPGLRERVRVKTSGATGGVRQPPDKMMSPSQALAKQIRQQQRARQQALVPAGP